MKLGLKLGNIEYKEIKLENIEVNVQYTAEELVTEFSLVKQILKDIPEMVADLGSGAIAFQEMESVFDNLNISTTEETTREERTELKNSSLAFVKTAVNKIKNELNKAV